MTRIRPILKRADAVESEGQATGQADVKMKNTSAVYRAGGLPDELWARVFTYLRPVDDQLPRLALVCTKWRDILRHTGRVWRILHIDPTHYDWWHFSLITTIFRVYGKHIQRLTWKEQSPVYESVFALISRLTSLKYLRLPILWTGAVVECLSSLKNLEDILINGGYALTDADLAHIACSFPRLKRVSLHACWAVSSAGVLSFYRALPDLQVMKLKVNSGLPMNDFRSEHAMMEGLRIVQTIADDTLHAHLLTVLCLHFVPVELDELWDIVKQSSALKKLSVSNCERLHGIRLVSASLQTLYLFNLWSVLFISINSSSLRRVTVDQGLESVEHLEIFAPKLRKLLVDGSNVLRTLSVRSQKLLVMEVSNCDDLDTRTLKETLTYNRTLACLRIGKISQPNFYLDEYSCPSIQEICLLGDFSCESLHIRSPTLRLLHTEAESDLDVLEHIYLVANHLCKVTLYGVPCLRSLTVQCVSVDSIELNLCSDEQMCLESCVIQAFTSIGFLRMFDCKVDMLAVCTPIAKTVVLYRCQVTDYALQMALTGCPAIDHLNLERCRSLTNVSVQVPPLKYLNLFGCKDVHRVELECERPIGVNLGFCPNVVFSLNGNEINLEDHGNKFVGGTEMVLPHQAIRWSHDTPPQVYEHAVDAE